MTFREDVHYVLEGLKSIETLRNREFLQQLMDVLYQAAQEHERVVERAAALARRVAELEERTRLIPSLVAQDGAYWKPGNPEPGPYCVACWDEDRRLIHLVPNAGGPGEMCPRCRRLRIV